MTAILTRQQLEDAAADCQALADIINGADNVDVTTRLGAVLPTIAKTLLLISAAASAVYNKWLFDTSTTMVDPGAGDVRLNNAAFASVTRIAFSETSAAGAAVSAFLAQLDDSVHSTRGILRLTKDAANFAEFAVTGNTTDHGTWQELIVTHLDSVGSFAAADPLFITFSASGDDGLGTGDVQAANNGTEFNAASFRTNLSIPAIADVVGKQTIPIAVGAFEPRSTNGCAVLAKTNGASGEPDVPYLAFDGAAAEYASIAFRMPKNWDGGTITAAFTGRRASGTGAADVVMGIRAVAIGNNESPAVAFGTAATATITCSTTTADMVMSGETGACTVAGTPADGDLVFFEIFRDAANAADTLNGVDFWLTAVDIFYTTNAATDA